MNTYKRNIAVSTFAVAVFALYSCDHKDLCFDHDSEYTLKAKAEYNLIWHENYDIYDDYDDFNLDWINEWPTFVGASSEELCPAQPTGLRVVSIRGDQSLGVSNITGNGGTIPVRSGGEYSLLFYNNDTETIVFDESGSAATTKATTRSKTRASYKGSPYVTTKSESTVTEPDVLFSGYVESFVPDRSLNEETIDVILNPVVYKYVINYEFESGFQYVALARGALAGMAESVYLKDGMTTDNPVTILFDCDLTSTGVFATVNSFGIPSYTPNTTVIHRRSSNTYGLNLEIRLKNGETVTYDFDVTDQVRIQPNGGIISVSGIVVPEELGKKGGSGFNVEISDWGEYEDVDITF
jgi:hypothetical protein